MSVYYQDEHVTLYHGDCLELADKWTCADVLVTDPPYGIAWKGTTWKTAQSHPGIMNDEDTAYREGALQAWGDKPALVFGHIQHPPPGRIRATLIYQKPPDSGFTGQGIGWRRDWEPIFALGEWEKSNQKRSSVLRTAAPSVVSVVAQRYPRDKGGGHPHTKPIDVMEQLITACPPGVIADPFAGSGSTLRAAKNLGRKAIGVELDERYCEVIAKRLDQYALDFGGVS